MMDAKYLAEIKAREQAATPGPWEADYNRPFSDDFVGIYEETEGYIIKAEDEDEGYSTRPEDAAFIAHARTDIPALIAEVENSHRETATLEKALELACKDHADGCTWHPESVTVESLMEYYVRESQPQRAQEQEGKK